MDLRWSDSIGADPRPALAADAWTGLAGLRVATWGSTDVRLLELARRRLSALLRNPAAADRRPEQAPELTEVTADALSAWPSSPSFSDADRAALAFTEQFVMDVAGTTDADRSQLFAAVPAEQVGGFVMGLFVQDYDLRTRMVLSRLFGVDEAVLAEADRDLDRRVATGRVDLGEQFMGLLRTIALLSNVDPVTTELVRLRGARRHNCRICQSTRSVRAIRAGADEAMFDKVTTFESSDLEAPQKVALALTDRVITQPVELDGDLVADVRRFFTPAQAVELVYDVLRNSSQKVAVSLAADAPHVTEGVEYYDLDETGEVLFGQPVPVAG